MSGPGKKRAALPPSPYQQWVESEGVPVLDGFIVPDIRGNLPLEHWARKGVPGCFVKLRGGEGALDAYVIEIPAKGHTEPEKYMFEEEYVVLSGRGATSVWTDKGDKQTFEWQEGSIFSPPMNSWRQHFNGSVDQPVRLMAATTAPVMFNLLRSKQFIFNCNHIFEDRFSGEDDYFSGQGKALPNRIWRTNFVPDINSFPLQENSLRGTGNSSVNFEMANNTLRSHIAQFPVSTYKPAHRHGPGAHILILSGKGFSLMWEPGPKGTTKMHKFDWGPGAVFAPPDMWFHQHFNTGPVPVRFFAMHYGDWRITTEDMGPSPVMAEEGHQIFYEDEDPQVLEIYLSELAKNGVKPEPLNEWRVTKA